MDGLSAAQFFSEALLFTTASSVVGLVHVVLQGAFSLLDLLIRLPLLPHILYLLALSDEVACALGSLLGLFVGLGQNFRLLLRDD